LKDLDILRWKIFGESIDEAEAGKTYTISDFYPADAGDDARNPECIGSKLINGNATCKQLVVSSYTAGVGNDLEDKQDVAVGWSVARQCYTSEAGGIVAPAGEGDGGNAVVKNCSIATFMANHKKNYLTLTNIVNPELIGITDAVKFADSANIYYRVLAEGGTTGACGKSNSSNVLPREAAQISADGYAQGGKIKQSIDVSFKQNSFLPVFNFSMFVTSQNNPKDYARQ
jgi:hypothetical protein